MNGEIPASRPVSSMVRYIPRELTGCDAGDELADAEFFRFFGLHVSSHPSVEHVVAAAYAVVTGVGSLVSLGSWQSHVLHPPSSPHAFCSLG